jgi:hypothetical protein
MTRQECSQKAKSVVQKLFVTIMMSLLLLGLSLWSFVHHQSVYDKNIGKIDKITNFTIDECKAPIKIQVCKQSQCVINMYRPSETIPCTKCSMAIQLEKCSMEQFKNQQNERFHNIIGYNSYLWVYSLIGVIIFGTMSIIFWFLYVCVLFNFLSHNSHVSSIVV